MDQKRYARQIILPEIGVEGQGKISSGKVLCIGVGGLGAASTQYLAAAGVGRITLVDGDFVQLSNLQRQILFSNADVERRKVEVAAQRLKALNPDIEIVTHDKFLDLSLAEELICQHDIVVDGTDNFTTKFLINDICVKYEIPFVYGAISGFDGEVATFWSKQGPCYRCFRPSPPKYFVANCAQAGVIGAIAGLVGSAQALEVIRYLVAGKISQHPLAPEYGRLRMFGLSNSGEWQIKKNVDCTSCSKNADLSAIAMDKYDRCVSYEVSVEEISDIKPDDFLVDVREVKEWQESHIPGAINWPLSKFIENELPDLSKVSSRIVFYCKSGARSVQAAKIMNKNNKNSAVSLCGGIMEHYKPQL
ncbi:MAG: hypothetical protein A2Z20_07180 [Bdellovibrionales bacterium RBG_16_40_8]|nr:MAG: hypothetical protein A2Z20_07180 [Bdellovibrionales bacterium RBG_16_40_8]